MSKAIRAQHEDMTMEELIARLTASSGLDAGTAEKAVGMILAFLRKEAPGEAVESVIGGMPGAEDAIANAGGGGLMGMMGGGGVMGLGAQLMGAGLSMGQMQSVGKTLFEFGREKAGEDKMGEVIGQVPGLSQFM
jgi:hypothetical protein